MLEMNEIMRFQALRQRVMSAIRVELEKDSYCKSYEGCFEVLQSYPTYFDDPDGNSGPDWYMITLHCYVLGSHRHYEWSGKTFSKALDKAEKDINSFLK